MLNLRTNNRFLLQSPPSVSSGLAPPLVAAFPMRLTDLLLVSRRIHDEVKDLLFSVVTFKIDVRKDGAFMCGRRLLEPKRADGSSHMMAEEADKAKKKFLTSFAWASVKNYTVDILLENWGDAYPRINHGLNPPWDEEVEIYDIRGRYLIHTLDVSLKEADYVSVVVSGILAKSKKLFKLQVRLGLDDFQWDEYEILSNAKLLFSPFERLRNVRQPSIGGVFDGRPNNNSVYSVIPGTSQIYSAPTGHYENCCSVPSMPTNKPMLVAGMPAFDAYAAEWKHQISSESSNAITEEPPIRKMFTEFRNFYSELATYVPDVTFRNGRHTFLHRARVAREQEDVVAFREIRNELIHYWEAYKADEERKKREMDKRLGKLLESDMYPSHEWEDASPTRPQLPFGQTAQSPVLLDPDRMAQEGIPMTGNSGESRLYISDQQSVQLSQNLQSRQQEAQRQYAMRLQQQQPLSNLAASNMAARQGQQQQSQDHTSPLPPPPPPFPTQQRHTTNGSTSVPRKGHPTLSDYAFQHQQVLRAQAQAQAQARQQAQQQLHPRLIGKQQYQARQHALFQQSRDCFARLTRLKKEEGTIHQRANQVLSSLCTKQNPADAAKLQHNYKLQAHGMTLAVLEAQRKYDEVERERRILEKCLSRTTNMVAMGTQMNTMMEVGARKDRVLLDTSEFLQRKADKDSAGLKEEDKGDEEDDSNVSFDNEDLYSDPFHDDISARRTKEEEGAERGKRGRECDSATTITTTVDTTTQTPDSYMGDKRPSSPGMSEENLGGAQVRVEVGVGVPGPSVTKRRRIDSGYYEMMECNIDSSSNDERRQESEDSLRASQLRVQCEWKGSSYMGKGKGRMQGNGDAEIASSQD
ncbi:arid-like protein [Alternaria alternata]|nr:arid-like protein [Alternaria alternata]